MRLGYPRQEVLASWAMLGVLWLLCAPWVLPSNKLYHQVLISLLWLPGLLALGHAGFRRLLGQPELILFCLLGAWTLLVIAVQGGDDPLRKSKLPFYVLLSLLGVLVAAQQRRYPIERQLQAAALVAGPFALWSIVDFYILPGQGNRGRLVSIGLWDTAIMAAHAVGALAVLGCLLSRRPRAGWQLLAYLFAMLALALFLLLSQTRGVWVALLAALVVVALARPSRLALITLGMTALALLLLVLLAPELFTQRGLSYRPQLLQKGWTVFAEQWRLGLGFNEYWISVESQGRFYRHPHNLYLDLGIRWGLVGVALFLALWGCVAWRAWRNRGSVLGLALLGLWSFSSVALLTDGIGLWFKPNADWLITWLPVALSLVLAACGSNDVRCVEERRL
ncbi:O-antigen ligase [Stutzerimonas kunmingensis]|jgi:O-antigen ligase|uniref:O-antigen ligase family protein n=2 Tax=Stutzerimonas stutzeri group TaxID=136846 RepID=UPI0024203431|nr:O-antigen ligase family protein [Stutzerimonas kunmingensis]